MAAIFGEIKFFENWVTYSAEIPCGSKSVKIALSRTVFKIQAFLCFAIFPDKIQDGCRKNNPINMQ